MKTSTRLLLVLPAAALVAGSLTGCNAMGGAFADAWAVTYSVTLTGTDHATATNVSYLEAPSRGAESEAVTVADNPAMSAVTQDSSTYSVVAQVTAEKKAMITLTPAPGTIASCDILLDGTKSITTATGEPGAPVTCEIATPKFE